MVVPSKVAETAGDGAVVTTTAAVGSPDISSCADRRALFAAAIAARAVELSEGCSCVLTGEPSLPSLSPPSPPPPLLPPHLPGSGPYRFRQGRRANQLRQRYGQKYLESIDRPWQSKVAERA